MPPKRSGKGITTKEPTRMDLHLEADLEPEAETREERDREHRGRMTLASRVRMKWQGTTAETQTGMKRTASLELHHHRRHRQILPRQSSCTPKRRYSTPSQETADHPLPR